VRQGAVVDAQLTQGRRSPREVSSPYIGRLRVVAHTEPMPLEDLFIGSDDSSAKRVSERDVPELSASTLGRNDRR
jgi:hypothetical protein